MAVTKKLPDNQITVYQTPEGDINIEVLYAQMKMSGCLKSGWLSYSDAVQTTSRCTLKTSTKRRNLMILQLPRISR